MTGNARVRKIGMTALLLAVVAGTWWGWEHRYDWTRRNFREVVPGKIYAGGYQHCRQLDKILKEHQIRTVLCLRRDNANLSADERQFVTQRGVQFRRISVTERHEAEAESLAAIATAADEAVAILADPKNQPIYVHCWGGRHRTGLVIALYRVKYCGWSHEAAQAELEAWGGTTENMQFPTVVLADFCRRQDLAAKATQTHRR